MIGVEISTGESVEKVDDQGVIAAGNRIPAATVLWTAGVSASPVVKMLGTKTDHAGRAFVSPFLDIPEAPNVFVAGDATTITQDGHPVPGVAQAAIQQGRFVGYVIANRVRGRRDGRPFRYWNKGNMAVVGKNFAILESGYLHTSGFLTWLVWAALHVITLPQLQNRFRVQTQWFWSYLSGQRSSRLISEGSRFSSVLCGSSRDPQVGITAGSATGWGLVPVDASIIFRARCPHRSSGWRLDERNCELAEPPESSSRPVQMCDDMSRRQILLQGLHRGSFRGGYIDALQHAEADIPGLVGLYAKLSRMRALSSKPVVHCAEDVARKILDTYLEPDKSFVELREMAIDGTIDLLRGFSHACHDEFEEMRPSTFRACLARRRQMRWP